MTVYQVFPGIQLIYNDFEATEYEWESILDKDILEINHCREGREGSRLLSGSCLYLGEGDLSIHTMDNCASEMSFPLKHYRGISVVINLTTVSKNSPEILMEAGIDILAFRNKFCASGDCFIMRAKDEIEHIFSELYSIPDCLQKPYMKLKVQELLLFLYTVDAAKEKQRERYTSPHVETVCLLTREKSVKSYAYVDITPSELGMGGKVKKPTYKQIQAYVLETHGLKVSPLYIANVKDEFGLEKQFSYEEAGMSAKKRPNCPPEKRAAIIDALIHFGMLDEDARETE